jgi:hypothetical protein
VPDDYVDFSSLLLEYNVPWQTEGFCVTMNWPAIHMVEVDCAGFALNDGFVAVILKPSHFEREMDMIDGRK